MRNHERVDHEPRLNRAIDDIAARMTALAPTDLRGRVIDRLPTRRRAAGWRGTWTLAWLGTAAAVVIVAAIVWPRRESPARVVATNTTATASATTTGPGGDTSATAGHTVPARTRRPPASEPVVPGLPTLARLDALTIDDIQPTGLAIAQLHVAPIVTERLKMPPVEANGSGR